MINFPRSMVIVGWWSTGNQRNGGKSASRFSLDYTNSEFLTDISYKSWRWINSERIARRNGKIFLSPSRSGKGNKPTAWSSKSNVSREDLFKQEKIKKKVKLTGYEAGSVPRARCWSSLSCSYVRSYTKDDILSIVATKPRRPLRNRIRYLIITNHRFVAASRA